MASNVNPQVAGIQQGASSGYSVLNSAATTVLKTGPGILYGITVVTAGTGSTVTAYDNTAASGNILVNGLATTAAGPLATGIPPGGIAFSNGLTIVTTGAPAATLNVNFA